jgi:hypothetical protein
MTDSPTATRSAALLAALSAVAVAGCGSESKPAVGETPSQPAITTPAVVASPAGTEAAATGAAPASPAEVPAKPAPPKPKSFPVAPLAKIERRALEHLRSFQAAERRKEQLAAAQHAQATISAVRDLADAVLVSSGLEFATFDVIDGGKTVTVNVLKRDACKLTPSDPVDIQEAILDGSTIVNNVHLRLDVGGSVRTYLKKHCQARAVPAGLGPIRFMQSGRGFYESKAFTIRRSGWTVDWTSASGLLQVYVYKDGKLQSGVANHQGRGNGRKTVRGTGKFTLRVAATAGWSLKVRDGAPPRRPVASPQGQPTTAP